MVVKIYTLGKSNFGNTVPRGTVRLELEPDVNLKVTFSLLSLSFNASSVKTDPSAGLPAIIVPKSAEILT